MNKRSIFVAVIFVCIFSLSLLALQFTAPFLADKLAQLNDLTVIADNSVLYTFYLCSIPAAVALFCLGRLLYNILKGHIFEVGNLKLLRALSWCCMAVAVITLAATHHFIPFFLVSVAMIFMFLIIRVVGICMRAGTELKEENNLTI